MGREIERSVGSRLATMLLVPIAGGAFGAFVGSRVAPDSPAGIGVSAVMLPLALFAGISLWFGAGMALGIVRLVTFAFLPPGRRLFERPVSMPPGSAMFVPASLAIAGVAGVLVGVLSAEASVFSTTALYALVGLAYGLLAWRLARLGYLSPPDGS